jgi:glycosyltransferase involved in cell wall biosynthesis
VTDPIWFWQRIVSPHMAGLVTALADRGREVVYVAQAPMSEDRAAQGWGQPDLGRAHLQYAPNRSTIERLISSAPPNSIHICQGLRGNGLVGIAQRALRSAGLQQWVVMETVREGGWIAAGAKRLAYRRLAATWRNHLRGILATGHRTPAWLVARGMPATKIHPFAYFLPQPELPSSQGYLGDTRFRILFVGTFDENKRLDLLIDAAADLDTDQLRVIAIGSGEREASLRSYAEERLGGRMSWLGRKQMSEVPALMCAADCLVLPSNHDGWGAVVSEALMVGTPAICSDRCGAAGVVRASGVGGVFPAGDAKSLSKLLGDTVALGRPSASKRLEVATWARCLSAEAGADYLLDILDGAASGKRATPPWSSGEVTFQA